MARFSFLVLVLLTLGACNNASSLKKVLAENPDILIEAMEKNPQKFAEALNKINAQARQIMQAKSREQDAARIDKEFQNPRAPKLEATRASRGNPKAPVTIVAYSDFQCPYCKRGAEALETIEKKYGDKVRLVFKHLPLAFHPLATPAAERFEAIAMQNPAKAYKFHDEVFKNQQTFVSEKEAFLDKTAKAVGADVARMKRDMKSAAVKTQIEEDTAEAKSFGISGTPAFLINGVALFGARPAQDFEQVIDRWLAQGDTRATASQK